MIHNIFLTSSFHIAKRKCLNSFGNAVVSQSLTIINNCIILNHLKFAWVNTVLKGQCVGNKMIG